MAATASCNYEAQKGLTFDLSPLMNNQQDYYVYDHLGVTGNKTFVFNICRDVVSIPKDGNGGNNCQRTVHDLDSDGNEILESRPVPVFLVDQDSDDCRRMAGSLEDEGNIYWSPYDYTDKAAGVSLRYDNGDYYFSGWLYYGTVLSIRCSDRTTIPTSADVQRYGISTYTIWLDSIYACPAECYPKSDGTICNGHGICMNDESVEATRCFCNTGRKGEDCSKSVGLSMTNYVMIVDIVAVIVVVITIIYLGCKLRKIRLDPDADVSLDTKFNELGSIAYTL
ncbi:hypothetical protein JH06_1902 [Blastocystis sp. subtype 4]|uniref:hypothetical protein n=1 Tax=Blastocystis sp. subtype 4 TaxID=944170 RepID=UPI0007115A7D|nr:hypothetical protein JH06_1902 [Blastocystis sp. subtype 4]KNB44173.1 hypothetical protein JH06_1902 [Blastocystis sp. subtype 4]|eukprot:XP_014527616.1 hypothetical protein JH06_1902 [Blastocystis sp. subtype 4]